MSLENEAVLLGRILAADSSLSVYVRGDIAYAKPGVVVLPSVEQFPLLSDGDAYRLWHGLADHEIGHAADTDFDAFSAAKEERAVLGEIVNILEDGYIEHRRGLLYNGSRYNLAKKNRWFWETPLADGQPVMKDIVAGAKGPWEALLGALAVHVRPWGRVEMAEIEALNPDIAELLEGCRDILDRLKTLAHESKQTPRVVELAREILARFESSGAPAEEKSDPGSDEDNLCQEIGGEIARFTSRVGLNPERAAGFAFRRGFKMPGDLPPYVVFDPSFDLERDFTKSHLDDHTGEFAALERNANAAADSLVFAFEAALRAPDGGTVLRPDEADGEAIDPEMLAAYSMGAADPSDIYMTEQRLLQGNAAVALLVDCSGSMHGRKAELARIVAIAMSQALSRVQLAHEVTGFTTVESNSIHHHDWFFDVRSQTADHFARLREVCVEAESRGTKLSDFARTATSAKGTLMVPAYGIFKGFDDADARGLMRIEGISQNLDGEAVLWQARRLANRPERRRVMFVISDGAPAGSHDNAQGARFLSESIARVIDTGIEVYGIGVQSDEVERYYPTWWMVNHLDDLVSLAMNAFIDVIARGQHVVGRDRADSSP